MRVVIFLLFLVFNFSAFTQNVSFDQVQNLRKQSLDAVETYLSSKGWAMTNAEEATLEKMGKVSFGYKVDPYDNEMAVSWISFYPSILGNSANRISIQLNQSTQYPIYMARLAANGYKLKKSEIIEGAIEKVYQGATTTCIVTTTTTPGRYTEGTSYIFFFMSNQTYKSLYEE